MATPICKQNARNRGHTPTFSDALDAWLADTRLRVKKSTYAAYAGAADRHVRPELGGLPVFELTSARVSKFLSDTEKNLEPASMRLVCRVMRGAASYARTLGAPLPAGGVIASPRQVRREARTLPPQDQLQLEAWLREDPGPVKLGILLSMHTGLRLGEICALRWGDISPDGSALCVRRTLQRIALPDGAQRRTVLVFDTPKSASSNRLIPVPASLRPLMEQLRAGDECYVLTGRENAPIEPRRMENRFKAALRAAGAQDINFHALRHTFATNCVKLGCDATTLSRILGHSDVSVTLNIYVHPSFDSMRKLMDKL